MKNGFSMLIPMSEEDKQKVKTAAKKAGYTLGGLTRKLLIAFSEGKTEQVKPQETEVQG